MNQTTLFVHLENNQYDLIVATKYEDLVKINLCGDYIFMTTKQAEVLLNSLLLNSLDKNLHEDTYTDLEDKCLNLESDLVAANELIEELEDRVQENCCQVN